VLDGGTPGTDGDSIGSTGSLGTDLKAACDDVMDGNQFGRQGVLSDGNLVVHYDAD